MKIAITLQNCTTSFEYEFHGDIENAITAFKANEFLLVKSPSGSNIYIRTSQILYFSIIK